ncbi:hypothetical protein RYZ18_00075 [Roseovarius sp. 10]|uniref:hypothetical protein n=1 Tax=Roseovarius sp. 10 TaxID=3080563 RepID=UPI002952CA7B|nr:hypothetical protein [Roseovarius sp. 10]MDV7199715.1 hypothetical protein [Roseovarius sp. 10]
MLIDVAITHPPITTPDEDPRALEALMIALGEELNPKTHLERRQVELIAYSEWEIVRHRRFSARLLTHEAQRVSAEALREERSRLLPPKADQNANNSQGKEAARESMSEFGAVAYANHLNIHAHHEVSVERLEARRRQLLKDFHDLQARRALANIDDAEVSEP